MRIDQHHTAEYRSATTISRVPHCASRTPPRTTRCRLQVPLAPTTLTTLTRSRVNRLQSKTHPPTTSKSKLLDLLQANLLSYLSTIHDFEISSASQLARRRPLLQVSSLSLQLDPVFPSARTPHPLSAHYPRCPHTTRDGASLFCWSGTLTKNLCPAPSFSSPLPRLHLLLTAGAPAAGCWLLDRLGLGREKKTVTRGGKTKGPLRQQLVDG